MSNIFLTLIVIFAPCFLFGIVYPLGALLFYPIYRLFGGRKGIKKYMKGI